MVVPHFGFESRIQRALIWFQGIILASLVIRVTFDRGVGEAIGVGVILGIHVGVHAAAWSLWRTLSESPAIRRSAWLPWGLTLVDFLVAVSAFYLSGSISGHGGLLGYGLVAIVATRFALWPALAVNGVAWALFSLPFVAPGKASVPPGWAVPVFGTFVAFLLLTFAVGYLASMETHQARVARDAAERLRRLSTIQEVSRSITSTLDMEALLALIVEKAVEILDAQAGSILLLDDVSATQTEPDFASAAPPEPTRDLVFRVVLGPVVQALAGTRMPASAGIAGAVLSSGQGQVVNDVRADPRWNSAPDLATGFETRSLVCVPLLSRGESLGVLEVINKYGDRPFDRDDLELLSTFADQAAIALENARLYEMTSVRHLQEAQRRYEESQLLLRVTESLSTTLDLTEAVRRIARELCRGLKADMSGVYLPDETGTSLRSVAGYHVPKDKVEFYREFTIPIAGHPFVEEAWHTRQAVYTTDLAHDPRIDPATREAFPHQTAVFVPIVTREGVIGGVYLVWMTQKRELTPDELRLANAMARQAGTIIENARLYALTDKRLQARLEELTALQHTIQQINASLEPDSVLQMVLEWAFHTTQATHGNIMLRDLDTDQFVLRNSHGYSEKEKQTIASALLENPQSVTCQVAESGQPHIVGDTWSETAPVCVKPATRSAMVVPIVYGGVVMGLITLCHSEPGAFDDEDLRFVRALADQAAVAIGNALRFEEQTTVNVALTRRTEQMGRILTISQKMRADVPLRDVLEEIAYAIQETVGYNVVLVSVAEGTPPRFRRVTAAGLPVNVFEEMKQVLQPVARFEQLLREEYRQGACYFFPFEREADWSTELQTYTVLPEPREWEEGAWHPRDMLLAPLRSTTGQLIGMISVDDPANGRRPNEQTLEALTIFADQAALAVENANLYLDIQRRADSLALINSVARVLAQVPEPGQVINTVVRAVADLVHCELSAMFLIDPGDGKLGPVASVGTPLTGLAGLRFGIGEGLVGHVAITHAPLLIPDTDHEPRFVPGPVPVGSMMLVPMAAGRRVLGVLTAGSSEKHAFTPADQVLLMTLADQATVALESARLFHSTQQAAVQLSLLNEIGRRAAAQLELQEMLDTTVNALHENLGYFRVAVFLIDQPAGSRGADGAGRELYTAAANKDFRRVLPAGFRQKVGDGLIGAAAASGKTLLCNDTSSDRRYLRLGEWDSPASLSVPIKIAAQVVGVLEVEADKPNAFTESDASALEIAADQLAVAIQNARLFQESQRRVAELAAINELGRVISAALDLNIVLETVCQQASRLFDTTNFLIATYEQGSEEWLAVYHLEHGKRQPVTRHRLDDGLVGHVLRAREPLLIGSEADVVAFHEAQALRPVGKAAKTWMGVPLLAANEVVGAMAVQSYEQENLYTEQDLALFSTIAAQTAVAMRNAQLYEEIVQLSSELEKKVQARTLDLEQALRELTKERDRAETLYRITSDLGTTLDLERVLQRALKLFADALGVHHGTVMLLDHETGYLTIRASLEEGPAIPREGRPTAYRRGIGMAGWVLEHNQPALIPDVAADPRWQSDPDKEQAFRSALVVPLSLGGDVLGMLTLGHADAAYFTQEHLKMVTAAAAQVAIAVNNSDLYAYITEQADQLGVMLQTQRAESAKSRAILESIADGVLVLDGNGRVLLLNPAAEEMLGLSGMVLQDEHFRHMLGLGETEVDRELAQALYFHLKRKMEGGDQAPAGTTLRLQAGPRVLAVNMSPLIIGPTESPGLVAALRDISREAEVERLKNEFISTVSHELRTPMTSIKGFTDLLFLGMAGGLTDTQRNFLQIIKSNVDRLTALVNDILDISRIETGRVRLTIEPLDMGAIISQVVATFQGQYRDKNLTLHWNKPENLPQIRGDQARITQILTNLIANAWQYTPAGGQVTVTAGPHAAAEGFLQVDVADTGIGISPDDIGRVFDRFFRADHPVVQEAGGSGLGLSIVKMFVEMLGGKIWLDSELGIGSTFHFTIPVHSPELPEITSAGELILAKAPAPSARRPKILVVEDDRDLALLLRKELEVEGLNVLLAGSGQDALWLAREEQPQLITLDLMLPDLDGFLVLEQLKDHPVTAAIPVIIVSLLSEPDKGYALGAVDYVLKPFSEVELLDSIEQALHATQRTAQTPAARLLVVDDEPDVLAFLEQALSLHGYVVTPANSGSEALELTKAISPDLILLDLKMPGMDGYEVIRRLKNDLTTAAIPVIVITASPVDKKRDQVRVLTLGPAHYMTQPMSIEALVAAIKRAIKEQ